MLVSGASPVQDVRQGRRESGRLTASKLKCDLLKWFFCCRALSSFSCFARFLAASLSLGMERNNWGSALSERMCDLRSIGRDCLYRLASVDRDGSFLNCAFHDARMACSFFLTLMSVIGSEGRCLRASTSWSSMHAAMKKG